MTGELLFLRWHEGGYDGAEGSFFQGRRKVDLEEVFLGEGGCVDVMILEDDEGGDSRESAS